MSKKGRLWFPLDVNFWSDPDIVALGEKTAVVFQRLIAYSKQHQTNGIVPMDVFKELGGRWWKNHLSRLNAAPLVTVSTDVVTTQRRHNDVVTSAETCRIVAYLSWNDSSDDIEQRRRTAREKKKAQRAERPNVPRGQTVVVPLHREEIEKRRELKKPDAGDLVPAYLAGWRARRGETPVPERVGLGGGPGVDEVLRQASSVEELTRALEAFWEDYTCRYRRGWKVSALAEHYRRLADHGPADEYGAPYKLETSSVNDGRGLVI